MPATLFRAVVRTLTLVAVVVSCGGSFLLGYSIGYVEGSCDITKVDGRELQAALQYIRNKPGR